VNLAINQITGTDMTIIRNMKTTKTNMVLILNIKRIKKNIRTKLVNKFSNMPDGSLSIFKTYTHVVAWQALIQLATLGSCLPE
jgi:hypothetical protein